SSTARRRARGSAGRRACRSPRRSTGPSSGTARTRPAPTCARSRSSRPGASRRGHRGRRRERAPLPLLRRAARAVVRRPRDERALEREPPGRAAERDGALLPAARLGVHLVLPGAARAVRVARAHLRRRLRLLLLVLGFLARALPRLHRGDDRALRLRREEPRGRDREQRRLPAAVL